IDGRIDERQKTVQGATATEFVGGTQVRERSTPDVLSFEQFSGNEVSIVHERAQLRVAGAQLLDNTGAIHEIGMRCVSEKFLDIIGTERHVPFAQERKLGIGITRAFPERAPDAVSVTLLGLLYHDGTGISCDLRSAILAVVLDDDDALDLGVRSEVLYSQPNTALVIVGGKDHCDF